MFDKSAIGKKNYLVMGGRQDHKKGRTNNGLRDLRNEILHLLIIFFNINCTMTQKHASICIILYSGTFHLV